MTDPKKLPIESDDFPADRELPAPVRAAIERLRDEAKTSPTAKRALVILQQLLSEVS